MHIIAMCLSRKTELSSSIWFLAQSWTKSNFPVGLMKIKFGKLWAGCSRGWILGSRRVTNCKTGRAWVGHRFTVEGLYDYPKDKHAKEESLLSLEQLLLPTQGSRVWVKHRHRPDLYTTCWCAEKLQERLNKTISGARPGQPQPALCSL